LLLIRSGPVWNIDLQLGFFAAAYATRFEGEVLTWSSRGQRIDLGRFRVRAFEWGPTWLPTLLRRARYTLRVLMRGLWIRWGKGRPLVVITYDPFQSGMIGILLRWTTGAIFICEVNGVYGHEDTLIDMADRRAAEAKRASMLRIGSWVLRRAHFIKLLYPGQLVGFSVPEESPPRESFHELVNTAAFEPQGIEPEKRFIFVGHPYLLKGVDLLLEAFSRIARDDRAWRLLLVGWQIEEAARDAEFPRDRVDFLGPQVPEALRDHIERSAALVLPSRSEGMGRVLLEAAFLGRPRIGSRAGGIPEVIDDGTDGLLFDTGDANALERAMRRMLEASDEERRAMGARARARALRQFSTEAYLGRYEQIIARFFPAIRQQC